MLCPNTQAVINGYAAGWGPRPFFPKRAEIWIWGWKNVYMKKRVNLDLSMGNFCAAKKVIRIFEQCR